MLGTVVGGRYYVRRAAAAKAGWGASTRPSTSTSASACALKILHPAYSQTPDLVERLRREARAASKISHPNVVDVTDSGTTPDGAFFFVMEYLEGIELGELIYREKRLDIRRTLIIGTQICRALQAAHEVNVIHRDLKPENVLILKRDGQPNFVKVLDFGIAKSGNESDLKESQGGQRRLTHPGMTMGTPEYMAPEQASGKPADPRSDVYAVGGLLYEMLTGQSALRRARTSWRSSTRRRTRMPAPLSTVRNDVPAAARGADHARDGEGSGAAAAVDGGAGEGAAEHRDAAVLELQQRAAAASPIRRRRPACSGALPGVGGRERAVSRVRGLGSQDEGGGRRGRRGRPGARVHLGRARRATADGQDKRRDCAGRAGGAASAGRAARRSPPTTAPPRRRRPSRRPRQAAEEDTAEARRQATRTEDTPRRPTATRTTAGKAKTPVRVASAAAGAESKKLLADGERLLRAERFAEAREIFEKLTKSKRERGQALVGLAEISFQEKKYADAARAAELAAERGGGVKARVLLGDAHFRLARYKEAAKAYEDALKIDPGNASAKSGLALANKRM